MAVNRPHCTYPPTDYSVTLPEVVDFHRKYNPNESAYVFSQNDTSEPTLVSFLEFGRAADRVAHCIRPGRSGRDRQVVAFIALSDTLLYQAVTLGLTRSGFIPYPMSPRNTASAIIKLLKDTSCHRILTTYQTLGTLIDQIKTELASTDPTYDLTIDEVPLLSDIFPKLGHEKLPDLFEEYPTGRRAGLDEVLMYLHSSGSTGLPKTVPQTFRSMVHWAALPPVTDNITHKVPLTMGSHALPAFHTLGIIAQLLVSLYAMTPVGLYPPIATTPTSRPVVPSPDNIIDHIRRTKCNCLVIIPAILQVWAQDPKTMSFLSNIEYVAYSGGLLPSKLGNFLTNAGVYLISAYGGTEFGAVVKFFKKEGEEKYWEWVRFSDDASIYWNRQGDDMHELQFLTSDRHQVSVENLPNMRGYATSDLWVQHPKMADMWKIIGRKDDVIVHSSGEKTVPAPMENIMMSSTYIMAAIMFGRERDQAGVLIELNPTYAIDTANPAALSAMRNTLWPIVEEANRAAPAFSRIFKELILIASRDKPLPRAGKGTVMRKAAVAEYAKEIDDIYTKVYASASAKVEAAVPPRSWSTCNVEAWLCTQIKDIHSGRVFDILGDFFEQGMDSLGATILRRRIVGAMQSNETKRAAKLISQVAVYDNPSIKRLSKFLAHVVADPENFWFTNCKIEAIETMIAKYSNSLPAPLTSRSKQAPRDDGAVVLLTGSTGNLGAQLLSSLLENPGVRMVYALNRPASGTRSIPQRQKERLKDKGLDTLILESDRLVFLEGETREERLGLVDAVYDDLRSTVTMVIHNAWRLDFNLSLSSFEANIRGTRNLIDFARSAEHAATLRFLFTSSVSSAFSWDKARGAYPEDIVKDAKYAVGSGYGESKYVAERLLSKSGLKATSFRIGQISGGMPNGAWATSDWVPILVKSSLWLNALPSAVGAASWLPMDAVSQTILDVAWSRTSEPALNIVHPRPTSWNVILDSINDAIVAEGLAPKKLPFVNFSTWVAQLEEHAADSSPEALTIPGIKLLDFFRYMSEMDAALQQEDGEGTETGGLPVFATCKMQGISQTLRLLPSIGATDARRWMSYWKSTGFFDYHC